MALSQNAANNGARWEVVWRGSPPKSKLTRKKFDEDFGSALNTYYLLRAAGKQSVTLRCCNIGFPPPHHITQHPTTSWRVVRHKGKKYKRKVTTYEDLLQTTYNPRGIWWCPYCIQLRRFAPIWINPRGSPMGCPVCGITDRDWYVRHYNPQASITEWRQSGRRRNRRTRRT
jgi:hypothetical protein